MRFGALILSDKRWSEARDQWIRAESLGFDHAWTYDHLAWRSLRDHMWFAALPTLAAAAFVTERMRLGTLVSTPNFRHPLPFAKELVALDDLTGGRFTVGLGAGATTWDTTMLGEEPWSLRERSGRFAELVEMLDVLLREPATSWRGQYYAADEARMHPGCVQQPRLPFAVAATGPRGMRLAATFGQTWVTTGDRQAGQGIDAVTGAKTVAEQMRRLEDVCAEVGRDPETLDRLVVAGGVLRAGTDSPAEFEDTWGRYAAIGITDFVLHWPRDEEPYAQDQATFEAAVAPALGR